LRLRDGDLEDRSTSGPGETPESLFPRFAVGLRNGLNPAVGSY